MNAPSVFPGTIGTTVHESTPHWPERRERNGAPNVVVVVFDDTGWADFGCFGSEIATPTLDRLAAGGTRLTNFHVTPLCSPTRACLLTGRNHHSVGMRFLAVADTGFPNARARLPLGVPTLPGVLRDHGYGTYLSGKWHLAPQEELTPAGPFANWPLARGFDRFYGFLSGANDEFAPELISDNSPAVHPGGEDYHLSADLVDHAIGFLSDHVGFRPADPFFLQLAFGATHAPFQAPERYIERYRGVFDGGWEATRAARLERQMALGVVPPGTDLTEHDAEVPRWEELSDEERRSSATCQEAYAGYLEHADAELGRLVDWLEQQQQLDETVIVVFSDNGAAGDGGRTGAASVIALYNDLGHDRSASAIPLAEIGSRTGPAHYATGWAMASNTPFRLYKQYVDLGGVRSPCIVRWRGGMPAAQQISAEFAHVIDLAPTILEAAGCLETDAGRAMHGRSLRPVLVGASTGEPRTQYFEMLGHRGIWHDGWKAVTRHRLGAPFADDRWR
ncbi:MAG: arylsulfatase, partial [Acidimicrobiales bacterium]